jgi:hypothetical protein
LVLHGRETWFLILRQEHRLRVFENRELRKISGPQRKKGRGDWRKLHNERLNDFYYPVNIIQVIKPRMKKYMGCVANRGEKNTGFWHGKLNERDKIKHFRIDVVVGVVVVVVVIIIIIIIIKICKETGVQLDKKHW